MHRLLTLDELARESDTPPALVAQMVAIGAFAAEPDGLDDLAWAIGGGRAAFEAIARHYATPAARSPRGAPPPRAPHETTSSGRHRPTWPVAGAPDAKLRRRWAAGRST